MNRHPKISYSLCAIAAAAAISWATCFSTHAFTLAAAAFAIIVFIPYFFFGETITRFKLDDVRDRTAAKFALQAFILFVISRQTDQIFAHEPSSDVRATITFSGILALTILWAAIIFIHERFRGMSDQDIKDYVHFRATMH